MQAVLVDTLKGIEEVTLKIDKLLNEDVDRRALVCTPRNQD